MRTIKRKRLENSNDVEIECNSLLDEHSSTKRQSPNNVSSSINQQQQHQELSPPDDQNICSGQESPPSTNDFKTPLPVTNDHFNIRRKSNRILSLKRLNQSLQQQNSNLVTSSTSDHNDLQQQQAQISECDQNSIPAFDTGQKPNQTSDISSTALNNEANSNCNQIKNSSSTTTSVTTANTSNSNSGKSLRKIQAWTEDDIRWFFEALGEHGKDFPHIQSYIASRCEKKGIAPEMIKNYEQVRHFYYRMWHKISQLLKISANVDKGIQEIYGLINYGEIWKRFGPKFDCRLNVSLQQLVDYGYTVVKMKGKNVRIRTPVCNALKKIHNIDNKINKPATQPSMPKEIQIELIPATNSDWIRVHSLAQNPRLRTKLSMQQRLSTLISYLEKRWNPNRLLNNDLIDQSSLNNDNCHIRLRAQNSARLCDVTLKSTANSISYHSYRSTTHGTGQIDVSLSAYLKNTFNDANSLMKKSKMNKKTAAAAAKKSTNISMDTNGLTAISKDTNIECCECPNVDNNNKDERNEKDDDNGNDPQPIDLFKLLDSMNEELEVSPRNHYMNDKNKSYSEWKNDYEQESITNSTQSVNDIDDDDIRLPEPPSNQTLAQWLSGGGDIDDEDDDSGVGSVDVNKPILNDDLDGDNESSQKNISDNDQSIKITDISKSNRKRSCTKDLTETVEMLTAEQALIGWTLNEGKMVTIGELYLLFCQPEKITLEYSWIVVDEKDSLVCDEIQSKPLNTLKKFLIAAEMTLMNYKKSTNNNNNNLSISSSNLRKRQANKNSTTTTTTNTITNQQQPNSQLLSNLIQETILNDNVTNNPEQSSNQNDDNISDEDGRNSKPIIATKSGHSSKSNLNKSSCLVSNENGEKIKTIKNNRTTAVLVDDPHKIDEVLKELKIRGRRAGRPVNKFMYNHHPNKILNMNGNSLSQPQPTSKSTVLLTVRASNLRQSVDGTIPKQIVLTAMTNDVKNPEKSSSVLIPIQLETAAKSSSSTTTDSTTYFQLMPSTQNLSIQTDSTVTMTEMDKTNEWFSNSTQDGSFLLSNDYHPLQSSSSSMVKTVEPVLVPLAPLPTDIETHMNTFAEDNSIDLMAKFADLAEQITSTDGGKSIH